MGSGLDLAFLVDAHKKDLGAQFLGFEFCSSGTFHCHSNVNVFFGASLRE